MSLPIVIEDGNGDGACARVSPYGQLIVGPVDYSIPSVQTMDVVDTGYSFIPPIQGKRIVITDMILFASSGVSAVTEAEVEIYESETATGTTVFKSILQMGLLKQTLLPLTGMNIITDEGVWVLGKTSDDDVKVSLYYYYIPV